LFFTLSKSAKGQKYKSGDDISRLHKNIVGEG